MRVFKTVLRVKAGGTMNTTTGEMTGGVALGHFMTSARLSGNRAVLTSRLSAGPTIQDTDELDKTATLEIDCDTDSVENRNLLKYAMQGGYVEVTQFDGTPLAEIQKFGAWKFGDFGASGQKEVGTNTVTLVGTNSVLEAEWLTAQTDLPADGNGGGGGGG